MQRGAPRPIIYLPPASNFKAKSKLKQRRRNEVLHETVGIFQNDGDALKQKARDNQTRWAAEAAARNWDTRTAENSLKVVCISGDLLDSAQALTKEHGKLFACINMASD